LPPPTRPPPLSPGATRIIATFMARAVSDDALPPAAVPSLPAGGVRDAAAALLAAPHAGEALASAWGAASGGGFDATRRAIGGVVAEFFAARGASAAAAALRALAVPFAHHELVKQALTAAATGAASEGDAVALLSALAAEGALSPAQALKGFERLDASLDAIAAAHPGARAAAARLAAAAEAGGWLDRGALAAAAADHAPLDAAAGAPSPTDVAYKAAALAAVREHFDAGDVGAVADALAAAGPRDASWIFVKHAVLASLDRRDREREAVSALLAALVPATVPRAAAAHGFAALLASSEDVALDAPDAPRALALFLGRAVVDEVLPPRCEGGAGEGKRGGAERPRAPGGLDPSLFPLASCLTASPRCAPTRWACLSWRPPAPRSRRAAPPRGLRAAGAAARPTPPRCAPRLPPCWPSTPPRATGARRGAACASLVGGSGREGEERGGSGGGSRPPALSLSRRPSVPPRARAPGPCRRRDGRGARGADARPAGGARRVRGGVGHPGRERRGPLRRRPGRPRTGLPARARGGGEAGGRVGGARGRGGRGEGRGRGGGGRRRVSACVCGCCTGRLSLYGDPGAGAALPPPPGGGSGARRGRTAA